MLGGNDNNNNNNNNNDTNEPEYIDADFIDLNDASLLKSPNREDQFGIGLTGSSQKPVLFDFSAELTLEGLCLHDDDNNIEGGGANSPPMTTKPKVRKSRESLAFFNHISAAAGKYDHFR